MKVQVGKYYRHTDGMEISIICVVKTAVHGWAWVIEQTGRPDFTPTMLMLNDDAGAGWTEITEEAWMKNFS